MMNRAVFLDRDGTINKQVEGHLTSWSEFSLLPNVLNALRRLAGSDYKVVVATNQSAVAHGLITQEDLEDIHCRMLAEVEAAGGRIDAVYVCLHHPDDGCGCRKPRIRLLELAAETFDLDLKASWFIGDKTTDVATGVAAGCKTILVETGYGGGDGLYDAKPDYRSKDLLEAVDLILP
jgi:histidinol-phosphate phosphatase family protein